MRVKIRLNLHSGSSQELEIFPGDVFGRASVPVQIDDPKVSSYHAKYELSENNEPLIVDLGSRNQLRMESGEFVKSFRLSPGARLYLGSTEIEVLEYLDPLPEKGSKDLDSLDYFLNFMDKSKEMIKSRPQPIKPFSPLVRLSVITGPQSGATWSLGYGPRFVGPNSIDMALHEPGLPEICFEIDYQLSDFLFYTEHPSLVLLNGTKVKSEKLYAGDVITMLNTSIKVEFIE